MKLKSFFVILFTTMLFSPLSSAKPDADFGFSKQELLKEVTPKLQNEVETFLDSLSWSDFSFCTLENESSFQACLNSKDRPFKFVIDVRSGKVIKIENGHKVALETYERIVVNKVAQALKSKIESESVTSEINSVDIPKNIISSYPPAYESDHCSNSPEVFPQSCQRHDACYASGTPKVACDEIFLENMYSEAESLTVYNPEPNREVYSTLMAVALLYAKAVENSEKALKAFCYATPNPQEFSICDEQLVNRNHELGNDVNTGTNSGTFTGQFSNGIHDGLTSFGANRTVSYRCQLWSFPNGFGGRYLMNRNCR